MHHDVPTRVFWACRRCINFNATADAVLMPRTRPPTVSCGCSSCKGEGKPRDYRTVERHIATNGLYQVIIIDDNYDTLNNCVFISLRCHKSLNTEIETASRHPATVAMHLSQTTTSNRTKRCVQRIQRTIGGAFLMRPLKVKTYAPTNTCVNRLPGILTRPLSPRCWSVF